MANRKSISVFFAAISAATTLAMPTFAQAQTAEVASGVVTGTSLGGGEWQYNINLTNNSSADNANTTIGTFWFSWAPGEDFMEAFPTNVVAPTGWTAAITGRAHAGDGNAIQFVALSTDLLHAGSSLGGFQFDSTETPAQLAAPSSFFQNEAETQSAAFVGAPSSDTTEGGDVFTLSVVNGSITPTPPPPTGGGTTGGGTGGNTQGGTQGGTPPAVPLPAASSQALAALIGLGLLAAGRKLIKRPARD
jgi:hypothetical protein